MNETAKIDLSVAVLVFPVVALSYLTGWVFLEYLAAGLALCTVFLTVMWSYVVQKAVVADLTDDEEGLERFFTSHGPSMMVEKRTLNSFTPCIIETAAAILIISNGWHIIGGMLLTAVFLNVMGVLSQPTTDINFERDEDDDAE